MWSCYLSVPHVKLDRKIIKSCLFGYAPAASQTASSNLRESEMPTLKDKIHKICKCVIDFY